MSQNGDTTPFAPERSDACGGIEILQEAPGPQGVLGSVAVLRPEKEQPYVQGQIRLPKGARELQPHGYGQRSVALRRGINGVIHGDHHEEDVLARPGERGLDPAREGVGERGCGEGDLPLRHPEGVQTPAHQLERRRLARRCLQARIRARQRDQISGQLSHVPRARLLREGATTGHEQHEEASRDAHRAEYRSAAGLGQAVPRQFGLFQARALWSKGSSEQGLCRAPPL
jgi:hypothetical protein